MPTVLPPTALPSAASPSAEESARWRVEADGTLVFPTGLFGDLRVPQGADRAEAERLIARAHVFAAQSLADNTRRAYRVAWERYTAWCTHVMNVAPLSGDPGLIGMHLTALADPQPVRRPDGTAIMPKPLARKSIRVALDAIAMAHRWAGLHLPKDHPSIALVFDGILRGRAGEEERKAEPIKRGLLKAMIAATREGPAEGGARGARDRLLLLIGWGAALRRSELVALDFGDYQESPRGLLLTIRRAKGDQRGEGALVGIERAADPELDVLKALGDWRQLRDDVDHHAPLFVSLRRNGMPSGQRLTDRSVPDIVAGLVCKADPEASRQAALRGRSFSGHSLRAGFATEAGNAGADLHKVMKHLRHSKSETTAAYLRERDVWATAITGLAFGNPDAQ